ncbi:MAG: UDP-N-acetylmuramoyl-tripeptide--D-alanyl-D-alanine ligase [Spirulinaceae cyanobacterium SM2_1_0]|nr:UDP-N-acetylmuramoyl-tripeptide--D-alanyl-D-alanine ligase [Spirulinaceae cyanobacterium SM2_1_0]
MKVQQFSLAQLTEILTIIAADAPDRQIRSICTDSRQLQPGDAFLALRGDRYDGHQFLTAAVAAGAAALIVEVGTPCPVGIPCLAVADTLAAYQQIAQWWRSQFDIPVIGITGSVGKTTTKELIAAVLSQFGKVLKTEKNYNNEIGVPKTLLGLNADHDYAVIEMAMRGRGQIATLTHIARPTLRLITNVGTAHIGLLGSEQAIADAKCELLSTVPAGSRAILNADNARLMKTAAGVWSGETLTYGLEGGDLQGELLDLQTLRVAGLDFTLPLPGAHNASNFLAALATAHVLNLDWQRLTSGLVVTLPDGRAQRYELPNGITLLDETYNAGTESMLAALQLLQATPAQRHIAVLGTMKELGEQAAELHARVGRQVTELGIDVLFVLEEEPVAAEMAAAAAVPAYCLQQRADLIARLADFAQPGDCFLFKASNSVGLNQVVAALRQHWNCADVATTW